MSDKHKILYIAPANSIHSHKWIEYFSKKNFIWVSYNKINRETLNILNDKQKKNILKIKFLNSTYFPLLPMIMSLYYMFKYKPYVVHIHSIYKYSILSFLLFFFHKNIILTIWGTDFINHRDNFFLKYFFKFIFKKSKKITTDGHHIKNKVISLFDFTKNKFSIINFGMNSFFLNDNYDTNKLSDTILRILKEDQKFLFSSRGYWDYYDYLTVIEAFNKLDNDEIALVLAGSDGQPYYKKLLIDKIKKSKFDHKIYTLGHLNKDELKILYKKCYGYISASLHDAGISTSVAEAMASGAKCIVANNSDNNFWIENNKNGFLFENKNSEDLLNKIQMIEKINKLQLIELNSKKIDQNNKYENEMNKMEKIYFE